MELSKRSVYLAVGFVFLVLGLLNTGLSFYEGLPQNALWFCNTVLFVFSVGLLFEKDFLISSAVVSSLVIETLWLVDVFSFYFSGRLILGVASYLYLLNGFRLIFTFYHLTLLVVPLAVVIYRRKFYSSAWMVSSIHFLFLLVLTMAVGEGYVNCTMVECELGVFDFVYLVKPDIFPPFLFNWIFATIFIFILPNYLLVKLLGRFRFELVRRLD